MTVPIKTNFNVNLKILPFGQISLDLKGPKEIKGTIPEHSTTYTEQKTTNIKIIEIVFGGENYVVPKTTSGLP